MSTEEKMNIVQFIIRLQNPSYSHEQAKNGAIKVYQQGLLDAMIDDMKRFGALTKEERKNIFDNGEMMIMT